MYHHVDKQVEKRKARRAQAAPYSKPTKPKQHVVPLLLSEAALRQKINDGKVYDGLTAIFNEVKFAPEAATSEVVESKKATASPVKQS